MVRNGEWASLPSAISHSLYALIPNEIRFTGVGLFVTEGGEEDYLGGKTAEPSISSSEATGSSKSIVMPNPKSLVT